MLLALETLILALFARCSKNPGEAWLRWGRRAHQGARGLAFLERSAGMGNAEAEFELGLFFEGGGYGIGVRGKALDHYRRAAEFGHGEATYRMGEMLRWGIGVAADPEAGRRAYRRAAEMGWRPAAEWLASALETGDGMEPDAELSAFWRTRAAKLELRPPSRSALLPRTDEPDRHPSLGLAKILPDGAREWLGEAAHGVWFRWIFWLLLLPLGMAAILALVGGAISFIGFAQFLSAPWVTVAFLLISFGAPGLLLLYFWLSTHQGMHWSFRGRRHQSKAEAGDPKACFERGIAFLNGGPETPKDAAEARRWLRWAAEGGHVVAMVQLAEMLRYAHGGLKDVPGARDWLKLASDKGHVEAAGALEELSRPGAEPGKS